MSDYIVKHSCRKIELFQNEESLGYLDYHEGIGSLYIDYVFVKPQHRGKNVGKNIVEEGIKFAKEKGLTPKPICSYAAKVMKRKGEI